MRGDRPALLVSVRPRFCRLLIDGSKSVELRRVRPTAIEPGDLLLLYESSPTKALVATSRVITIAQGSLDEIWETYGSATGISRLEYDEYFAGTERAVAIKLEAVTPLLRRRPLAELRQSVNGLRPPQSFRYLDAEQVAALVA